MNSFSATELARMRSTQESAMQDICKVLTYSGGTADAYGIEAAEYLNSEAAAETPCGVEPAAVKEIHGTGEVPIIDEKFRLPLSTVITNLDHIYLMTRYGEDLDEPETYEIVGHVKRGPSGLVVDAKRIGDG